MSSSDKQTPDANASMNSKKREGERQKDRPRESTEEVADWPLGDAMRQQTNRTRSPALTVPFRARPVMRCLG